MDIRKLNPTPASNNADRAHESNDAQRLQDARRISQARKNATRAANADLVDTSHANKVEKFAVRARTLIDERAERVRGREDELRRTGDDASAIRRAARRVLDLLDRPEYKLDAEQGSKTPYGDEV